MAIPLEPESGLFPDTLVAPFIVSPEVEHLAGLVIASFDEFRPIFEATRDQGLSIAYVFETKPWDPLKDEFKPHTIAKVTKASPLWRVLAEHELAIQFRQAFWDAFTEQQRIAVLHHEFTHVEVELDDQGRLKIGIRDHDVEDFTQTMRRFGPIIPGRAAFVKAFLDWQHEQDQPEPTKLRRVAKDDPTDEDLRPTGEVNADELHGAAKRDVDEAERATDGDDLLPA